MEEHGAQSAVADLEPVSPHRRRSPIFWVLSVVVVGVLVVGSLAFAGNDAKAWPATVVLSNAAARTTASGTARVRLTVTATLDGNTETIVDGDGACDYGTNASAMTLKVGPATEEIRLVNEVTYVSLPDGTLPRGAHWLSVTKADLKFDPKADAALSSNDPSTGLQFLSAIDGDPRVVGREKVDGEDVTHYAFTLDLKSLFDRLGDASEALNSSFGSEIKSLGSLVDFSKIPGEAWIDSNGRARKFEITIDVAQAGQLGRVVEDLYFSHFNEPVVVEAPPATDTVPFSEVPNLFSNDGG
jgi:hypothetical protein